jgi:DNA-binding beta-propeller fold protein YncE
MQAISVGGRVYNYSQTLGRGSDGGIGFRNPVDFAINPDGIIYVLSRGSDANQVQRITVLTTEEEFISEFGGPGSDDGQFVWPTSIVIDNEGMIFVADEWLNRITIFDNLGNFHSKWGQPGHEIGQLNGPAGLAFDSKGYLYVSENMGHRVQKFTKGGEHVKTWGRQGKLDGELIRPWGITVDFDDKVYVADWYNNRVQKFDSDGRFISIFGLQGPKLELPSSVAVDSEGDVYVTSWWNCKVEIFRADGSHITTLSGNADKLSKWAEEFLNQNPDYRKARQLVKDLEPEWAFFRPIAIKTTYNGKIWISEDERWRIQVYQKELDWDVPILNL